VFSLKALTLDRIIESTYKKGIELTPALLTEIADPQVSTYDITALLCTYINEQKKIANGKDLQELCTLKAKNEDVYRQLKGHLKTNKKPHPRQKSGHH
jgi:hypothetical protein